MADAGVKGVIAAGNSKIVQGIGQTFKVLGDIKDVVGMVAGVFGPEAKYPVKVSILFNESTSAQKRNHVFFLKGFTGCVFFWSEPHRRPRERSCGWNYEIHQVKQHCSVKHTHVWRS